MSDAELVRQIVDKINERYIDAGGDNLAPLSVIESYACWGVLYNETCILDSENDMGDVGGTDDLGRAKEIEELILKNIQEHANQMLLIFSANVPHRVHG